jgi:F-type H+-transporting ATPase subunit delta
MARSTSAPRRFAEAAFQLAERDGALDAWAEGLDLAARFLGDARVLPMVDSPARPYAERLAILDKLLTGRVPDGVVKLAGLLARRGRVERISAVAAEYHRLLDVERGIVEARVTSAVALTTDETEAVRAWAARTTGRTVNLTANVDESLIGGLTVRVGDTLLDASVRGRLERLRNELVAGVRTR